MTLGFLFYKIYVLSVSVLVTFKIKWVHTKPPCPSVYPLLPAEGASVEQVAPQHLLSTSQPLQQLLGRRAQRTSAGVLWWSHDDVVGILLQMTELGLLYMQSCWLSVCLSVCAGCTLQCLTLTGRFIWCSAGWQFDSWLSDRREKSGVTASRGSFFRGIMTNVELWFLLPFDSWQGERGGLF